MCGIAGLIRFDAKDEETLNRSVVSEMSARLQHRGPDDQGVWAEGSVALAHRRLSVVDLSATGHQPMVSRDGRWVLTYNGEIYNAEAIRKRLGLEQWRGHSDTEVLLEAVASWGVEKAVNELVGMFAFGVLDTCQKKLWLCRDRIGIKPLYYGWDHRNFAFASELTALRQGLSDPELNQAALNTFLRHGFVPGPHSIYSNVYKLIPGTMLCISTSGLPVQTPQPQPYWRLRDYTSINTTLDIRDAQTHLHNLLRQAVRDRLVADVPLGAFLSGGFDSSLVCALMQEHASRPVKTFTIGFEDTNYNEAQHAAEVARHLGTEHHEMYVSESDMLRAVEQLPLLCDEPFADSSILPTFLVSRMARREVTVALSGDGGDELFWGYQRYALADNLWNKIRLIPSPLRSIIAEISMHPVTQNLTSRIPAGAIGGRKGPLSQKLRTLSELIGRSGHKNLYEGLMSHWRSPEEACLQTEELRTPYNDPDHWTLALPTMQRMALQDTLAYLPDDILAKVDRASMAVSLEARVPLLDHRVVEFVNQLPGAFRKQPNQPKYLLKQILDGYVPNELTNRRKMGFGVPLATWLRGPLRDWTEHLLDSRRIADEGLLNPEPIRAKWQAHLQGRANHAAQLWNVMMLQAWLEQSKQDAQTSSAINDRR